MHIYIQNLRLRTFIGVHDWEQANKQDVVINIQIDCSKQAMRACESDDIHDALDYKHINKKIITYVEQGRFALLEKMVKGIGDIILAEDKAVGTRVRAEKPGALRFSDAVAVELCLVKDVVS